jgi:hypothetical protein
MAAGYNMKLEAGPGTRTMQEFDSHARRKQICGLHVGQEAVIAVFRGRSGSVTQCVIEAPVVREITFDALR